MLKAKQLGETVFIVNGREELIFSVQFTTPERAEQVKEAFNEEEIATRSPVVARPV